MQVHTEETLRTLNLPGFHDEATFWEAAQPGTDWQTVLSLSIYSANPENPDQTDVLTAIRTDDTETHARVVSTPTGRFPKIFEAALLETKKALIYEAPEFRLAELNAKKRVVIASFYPEAQPLPDRSDPLPFIAHEMLARKLGLGEALQRKEGSHPIGAISLSNVVAGFSYAADSKENGEPLWEPLTMYAAAVFLRDRDIVPASTSAYRNISWANAGSFAEGEQNKQAELLIPNIAPEDEATVCVRGLCLASTAIVTTGPRFDDHLASLREIALAS